MSEAEGQVYMGDEAKRYRVVPLVVGSINVPGTPDQGEHPPVAMMLTIDVDAVPGFREVLARQQGGEEFDVSSRWATAIDKKGRRPPELVLDFYLPEFDLGVAIHINVDQHPDSIGAAVRTNRVIIVDPEISLRLQREPLKGTLEDLRVFTVQPPDSSPAIGVLQQRFDLPRETYMPERHEPTSTEELEEFFAGGRTPTAASVQIRGDGLSVITLIDPDVGSMKEKIPDEARVDGAWGVIAAGGHSVLAFEASAKGERLGRWLIPDPPEDIVLAGSHGAHWVVLASQPSGQEGGAESWWKSAIHVLVEQVEALRALHIARAEAAEAEASPPLPAP